MILQQFTRKKLIVFIEQKSLKPFATLIQICQIHRFVDQSANADLKTWQYLRLRLKIIC